MIELDIKIRAKDQDTVKLFTDFMITSLSAANQMGQIDVTLSAEKDGDTITLVRKEIIKKDPKVQVKQYPVTWGLFNSDYCYKPCLECHGIGFVAESICCGASITDGICTDCNKSTKASKCSVCNGSGVVDYTEEDLQNDMENEIIGNNEIKNDLI